MCLGRADNDALREERCPRTEEMQLVGSEGWWLLYTQLCLGTQNGNLGLDQSGP